MKDTEQQPRETPPDEGEHEVEPAEATPHANPDAGDADADAASGADTDDVETLRRQRDQYLAHWQRAQADYKNLRRRGLADQEAFAARRLEPLLTDLLLVLDYLEYALRSPVESPDARNLAAGVELTAKQLLAVLESYGLERIPTDGPFDPAVHEAVGTEPAGDLEPGTIVAVVRAGYKAGDKVLRAAQVRVASDDDHDPTGGAPPE